MMYVGLSMGLLKAHSGVALACGILLCAVAAAGATQTEPGQLAPDASLSPAAAPPRAQPRQRLQPPLEFESHGMDYESLTKDGVTVMFAPLPVHVSKYNIVQATVTNGSPVSWTVRAANFTFVRQDGTVLRSVSADEVVAGFLRKAGRTDVIKLELLYEQSIYALSNYRSTNGYEQRREAAMAEFVNKSFKAAAEASAIIFAPTKLNPGDSTDGAIFFENRTKQKGLGAGRFIAHTCGEMFVFEVYPGLKAK
ncbi:MAG: hypothetical protein ACRD4O_11710 [Bryobacteraceae bacterium]